ncbi:MAG: IclR family transcriptional regulator [Rhizobiaceae bacterium]|nr:IclR family transcriptional regulator [Rhizobiaceae bacterium]MCV0407230.1 IclR family transcriptional regulator [Rhizobiaceae bacterium]
MSDNDNRSISRTFAILRAFEGGARRLTLTELATTCGLNKTTVLRIARSLVAEGVLQRDQSGTFSVAYGLLALAIAEIGSNGLLELAAGPLEAARNTCGETVQLNVLSGNEVVVLAHRVSRHPLRWDQPPGRRSPVHAGAASLSILAFLDENKASAMLAEADLVLPGSGRRLELPDLLSRLETTRRQGYIVTSGERIAGGWGVGAPVFDGAGQVFASVSVNGPISRLMQDNVQANAIRAAREAAEALSLALKRNGTSMEGVAASAAT